MKTTSTCEYCGYEKSDLQTADLPGLRGALACGDCRGQTKAEKAKRAALTEMERVYRSDW